MIALARVFARLVGFLAAVALSVAGILVAVFCISGGRSGPSLSQGAADAHLPQLRDTTAHWLAQIEAPGSVAVIAGLCGLGAVLLGLFLLAGIFIPRRERLVTLDSGDGGTLAARRRPLAQVATALVEQVTAITSARVRVRPRRTTGGRMTVKATRTQRSEVQEVRDAARERLSNLTNPFNLSPRVDVAKRTPRVS